MIARAAQPFELLDEALEARVVGEVPGAPGRLRFSHALVRDTLYDELSPARRRQLHAQAGEALEALYAANEEPHLAELAHHFVQATPAADAAAGGRVRMARGGPGEAGCSPSRRPSASTGSRSRRSTRRRSDAEAIAASCCSRSATPRRGAAISVRPRRRSWTPPTSRGSSAPPTRSLAPRSATAGATSGSVPARTGGSSRCSRMRWRRSPPGTPG